MLKNAFPVIVVLLGLSLLVYGPTNGPVSNEAEIRSLYKCDRLTKEILSTNVYCADPASAPEAKKQIANPYTYAGIAVTIMGGIHLLLSLKHQKLNSL